MGRALVVGSADTRANPVQTLQRLYSFDCVEAEDPYTAMAELCRRRVVYNAVILSLASLYREELPLISTIKRRFPHLEIWLTHTDGRQAALAEAMRLGADGLLGEDGLHRIAPTPPAAADVPVAAYPASADVEPDVAAAQEDEPATSTEGGETGGDETPIGEPVLSAEELRALLQDQPAAPPGNAPDASSSSHG